MQVPRDLRLVIRSFGSDPPVRAFPQVALLLPPFYSIQDGGETVEHTVNILSASQALDQVRSSPFYGTRMEADVHTAAERDSMV